MKDHINNLPLPRKVFLFSFFISLILVSITAGISLILQTNQMEKQMKYRVVEMSSLWSTTFDAKDIKRINEDRNAEHPAFQNITEKLTLVNEKSPYTNAVLLSTDVTNEDEIFILVSSKSYKKIGLHPFSNYEAGKVYLEGYKKAISTKNIISTEMYEDKYGPWISAFVPILGQDSEVVGVISFDINAELVTENRNKISAYIIAIFLLMTVSGYFMLKRGLKKVLYPVNEIIVGFNEVSNGNFDVKLKSVNQADLGILAERFNNMTSKLSLLFDRLSATSVEFGTNHKNPVSMHRFEEAIDEMEQILHKTKILRELQRAEKMNAIGQLAASVAHEIRNPMTVVKGFLQIFLAKDQMSDEERMYIRLMIEEMKRAETIINDYLSLAKPDIEQSEKVDAGETASKVLDLMNSYAMMSKNIMVVPNLSEGVIIQGNSSELKQVLINILKNGIEAMKVGGTLSISVYKDEKYGVFEISDTGIGMSAEELERLGTAFYSLKEKGTGIGLMVCYQIIERMKGKIEVQSQNGKGTTFKIFVPLTDDNVEYL
ncbi:ATP-binding protein [Bacillus sp. DTU_2020_1000418_1_SI_GHA_SEK_038]|uniref:ATP-binding protein n=1 Tax=Bacillus sp. DTU_2020_1000418_1_SI_GHA_SEK_038 TaxID=3077585 RepID=UPI0028EE356E|nr:ATP-binding protein [Bacillus sp. DTU_2020_1000418_1_SI_GHA_SEK_038]WNS73904.1 ATP-binding protein [Bacillus sp. DTU_2020_1000418_1_SI_GHA_SEK_038]